MSMTFLAAYIGAMLFLAKKRKKALPNKWYIKPLLVLIGACAVANTKIGPWIAERLNAFFEGPARWLDTTKPILATGLIGICAFVIWADIVKDKKADKPALFCLLMVPFLLLISTGPIAGQGATFSETIARTAVSIFGVATT